MGSIGSMKPAAGTPKVAHQCRIEVYCVRMEVCLSGGGGALFIQSQARAERSVTRQTHSSER
eukprot:2409248-Prymnesium_polylepis.1